MKKELAVQRGNAEGERKELVRAWPPRRRQRGELEALRTKPAGVEEELRDKTQTGSASGQIFRWGKEYVVLYKQQQNQQS